MECMCAQTRPWFIVSSGVLETEPMLIPREKSPLPEKFCSEEDRTHDAASRRTANSIIIIIVIIMSVFLERLST